MITLIDAGTFWLSLAAMNMLLLFSQYTEENLILFLPLEVTAAALFPVALIAYRLLHSSVNRQKSPSITHTHTHIDEESARELTET